MAIGFIYGVLILLLYNVAFYEQQTILPSNINSDLLLKFENSPFKAENDVIIDRKARLTVEPGCEIQFTKGRQLIVEGTLDARGTQDKRIKFTKVNDVINQTNEYPFKNNMYRLVEGETVQDGKLQVYYNSKWHYVCSTQFNWTEIDVNVTCKSLGYSNGTFYYYAPSNNLTSHMKIYMPRCVGHENNLFDCPGAVDPQLGLTACDGQNVVGLMCEGFDDQGIMSYDNWAGITFQKYAPYLKTQQFKSVFFNQSQSILEYVDIRHAGLIVNTNRYKPAYQYMPASAITVFQYAPRFNYIAIEYSLGNGLNYSNIEAPALITNSVFRFNRGHGVAAKTRFGNVTITNSIFNNNLGDGLKYMFNNTIWSQQEQEEYFQSRYVEYCDSQNPLSYPAYYRFKNPNYVRECSKTFSTDQDLRITLHFQKINIKSKYSTYWMEVYDGQTEKNALIANYTFEDGKTPESIYSRSNYMLVKLKFQCNYPTDQQLQPGQIKQMQQKQQWQQLQSQQYQYEKKLYDQYHRGDQQNLVPPLSLGQLSFQDQQNQLNLLDKQQREQQLKFDHNLQLKQHNYQHSGRIYCPYAGYDDITMYAIVGDLKHPDLLIRNSQFSKNSMNGVNVTNLHSLAQLNETLISENQLNGLHVQAGAGDISLYHTKVSSNLMNGINITYAGGLKEFNYSHISSNALYGIYANYDVVQELDNVFQNTTINGSIIELNALGGVWLGGYCNQSNITVNSSIFRYNQEDALVIESCKSADGVDWYTFLDQNDKKLKPKFKRDLNIIINYLTLNISWNLFESNRLHGLKINAIQNMVGLVTNNTFKFHHKGAMLITANNSKNGDSLIRNVSVQILNNKFCNNSGRYALSVALNELARPEVQSINISFNRFEYNSMSEPYRNRFNPRTSVSAVVLVSSSNVRINQNWFNNPASRLQIGTQLENYTSMINASYNWYNTLTPVYDLIYFSSNRDKCNQQWLKVRELIFDNSNRSNLAQIVYWPFACNDRLWPLESSIELPPPADFDISAVNSLGGVYNFGDSVLPVSSYTVTNDIIIRPGAKLTIRSGTELNFLNGIGILVLGELVIDGYLSSPVRFTLNEQQPLYQMPRPVIQKSAPVSNSTNSTLPPANLKFTPTLNVYLVDGSSPIEGRLRVEINGQYGTVCNRAWSITNSRIVCQQMGLILDPNMYLYSRWLPNDPRQDEPILMSEIQCDNLDTSIFECRHTKQTDHTCSHQDDVWLRCLKPSWAGIRYGLNSQPSSIRYAVFEHAGQYDYSRATLAPALQLDLLQHQISNLTFQQNQHTSLEIIYNQPLRKSVINNVEFVSNLGSGLVSRNSFLSINQLLGRNQLLKPTVEYDPYFSKDLLESVRLYSAQPRRGQDVRRELTRIENNQWHIGSEQMVLLYTDTEYNFGPQEFNIQIKTDNNRVLVVDLIDYNPNFNEEQVVFCEKFCQSSYMDPNSREWNLSSPSNTIFFPINTSYSVLHINYNVTSMKSGRLTFLVYTMRAPEPVYDYNNPSYVYIKNLMPENLFTINNSTFVGNRHSIVLKHYDNTEDHTGSLRKRYNYSTVIISNCSFDLNDQVLWVNTDPVIPTIHQRVNNLTVHVMQSIFDSNKDDILVSESGYQMFDLIPTVKLGPIGRINISIQDCVFKNNYGGIRSLYRYYEFSNSIWHYEIRNNLFTNNKQSMLKIRLPRISRFAYKNDWENTTHTMSIRNNEFISNDLFEIKIEGYYAQINITNNHFSDNTCRIGLVKLTGTEKDFYIYQNRVERNRGQFMFDLEARSHMDNHYEIQSLFSDNIIENNQNLSSPAPIALSAYPQPVDPNQKRDYASLLVHNSPSTYVIALRGIQNCTFNRNTFNNKLFDYEFVGALTTNTLNSTIDATVNWWGTADPNLISDRIFDIHEWNNHALVNFVPYFTNDIDSYLSRMKSNYSVFQNFAENVIGGIIDQDLTLFKTPVPYQVRADLTVMPGVTLYINSGVEMEFYPNVGILVLGDLKASGSEDNMIKMRPVKRDSNRVPYYSAGDGAASLGDKSGDLPDDHYTNFDYYNSMYLSSAKRLRFFDGLNSNEGFLQIYNATLRSWTMICDEQFTLATAAVVCKQMNKEFRSATIKSLYYYMSPLAQQPIWNQTFICLGNEDTLAECNTFANHRLSECSRRNYYVYVMCNEFQSERLGYEFSWGGVRFAQPYFETYQQQNQFGLPDTPLYIKPDFPSQTPESSYMYYVDMAGAGRLHNQPSPAVQLISRAPLISNTNIRESTSHGLEFLQSKSTVVLNKLKIASSFGHAVNSLQLNVQTTDQKSSFRVLTENSISNENLFSMIDICDPHKYYNLDQRVIIYYKYSSLPRDCVKIFRTRMSTTNLGGSGQIGLRFLQVSLVNNTIQNDTIEIYNGTLFRSNNLMASLTNTSDPDAFERFYLSRTDSLSIFMRASIGREYYGFIAEVLIYPTAQYLLTDTYIEISDCEFRDNHAGALKLVTAGERNPHLFISRNRFISNGYRLFNTTSDSALEITLQNTPKFYFGNNYLAYNYGGTNLRLHSGSGVLITNTVIFNNLYFANKNGTVLETSGALQLPYNELTIDKNMFIENQSPRTDIIHISGVISKFTRNQLIYNQGSHILYTQGFENVSTPRSQDITYNLFRENCAYGIENELEDPNRFRSTMVAASLKQIYFSNYLQNKDNDFELISLLDPLSVAYWMSLYESGPSTPIYSWDHDVTTTKVYDWNKLYGLLAHNGAINASYNYWGTVVDTEISARIRDKYDNSTLFEINYSPPVLDDFKLRDGKCELGWSLIDDTCYTYIGSYVTYREAELICAKFESRLARETVAPIKLPRFRKLARTSQFEYEAQSYRRMWLYTDIINGPEGKCLVIDDLGQVSSSCLELLPFICEKDPVFLGAAFRFKDEIAFALAAIAALIVCIVLLCALWLYKSRKRKKEHIDRQNTLRSSARTHRHMMINNASFSTLTSLNPARSNTGIYGGSQMSTNSDVLNASTTSNRLGARSVTGGIYNSQRNQYFASKRHRKPNTDPEDKSDNEPRIFVSTGLDSGDYYGAKSSSGISSDDNDVTIKKSLNKSSTSQYHIYDPNHKPVDYDDEEDTTTSDDLTVQNQNEHHSPGDSSIKTTETYTEAITSELSNKQFIQARLIKSNFQPDSSSTLNKNSTLDQRMKLPYMASYDHLMNITVNTDTDEDTNSRRLLTNKINTSNTGYLLKSPRNNQATLRDQNGSILSKSNSNMTIITPINNESVENQANNPVSSSDYENLSTNAINDILVNYPNQRTNTVGQNSTPVQFKKRTLLIQAEQNTIKPPPPPLGPPPSGPISNNPPSLTRLNPVAMNETIKSGSEDDDQESLMSCQLITSASLLINRNPVREAKRVVDNRMPPPTARKFVPVNKKIEGSTQTMTIKEDSVVNHSTSDPSKPPPMETAI